MTLIYKTAPLKIINHKADGYIKGYASVFHVQDQHNDVVMPGAFTKTLAKGKPAMLWMHDPEQPIGCWEKLFEDSYGLCVEGRLSLGTQQGKEAYELLKTGALSGLSIGYVTKRSTKARNSVKRYLQEIQLLEISLVTFPSNESARVTDVKSQSYVAKEIVLMTARDIIKRLEKTSRLLKS